MKTIKNEKARLFWVFLALWAVIIIVIVLGFVLIKPHEDIIQGQVEANEVRISGKIPGRILRFAVDEGSTVRKGDTLVWIDSPEVIAKLKQAKAAENAAEAQNQKAIKGARSEQIQAAYEMWQKAKAGVDIAKKSYDRIQQLYTKGVQPAQKRDEAEANYKAMVATEKAAKAQYEMAKNGAEKEDKMAAQALVDRAKGAVDEVSSYLHEIVLTSPLDGEISERFPKEGELVGTGAPIMNVIDLNDCWVTFSIREDKLNDFRMGNEFEATVPALGDAKVKLKINYIKCMGTYASWKATKTTGQFDVKTFEVRAKPLDKIEGLRPGMSVLIKK